MPQERNVKLNWYPEPRYDTVIFPAGAMTSATYFALPIGQTISGGAAAKTSADTNLKTAGIVGRPNEFELHGFAVEPQYRTASNGADWALIYNTGVFSFQAGGSKNLLETPLSRIPVAGGPQGIGSSTADTLQLISNGAPFQSNYYAFHKLDPNTGEKVFITLDGDTNFSVVISYPLGTGVTLTTANRVRVYLIGYYGSSLQ